MILAVPISIGQDIRCRMRDIAPCPSVDAQIADIATHPVIEAANLLAGLRGLPNNLYGLGPNRIGDFRPRPGAGLIRATEILPTGKARGREAWGKV